MEAAVAEKRKLAAKDYKSDIKPIWCPGCGDYSVLNALTRALAELALRPEEVAVVSGPQQALRLELLPFNIQVTIIDPGDFKTSFTSNRQTVALPNVPDQYHDRFNQMLALYQSEEQDGSNPIIIAKHIEKLLTTKATPKVRYVLGKRLQTIGVLVKKIIGDTYFEKILRMMWKL